MRCSARLGEIVGDGDADHAGGAKRTILGAIDDDGRDRLAQSEQHFFPAKRYGLGLGGALPGAMDGEERRGLLHGGANGAIEPIGAGAQHVGDLHLGDSGRFETMQRAGGEVAGAGAKD